MAKYKACTMGITMAIEHQVKKLKVFGDLMLVIYQLYREWETCDAKLIPYHDHVMEMSEHFNNITFHYVPRDENQMPDTLATLSSMLLVNKEQEMTIQYHDIKGYLEEGAYLLGATENDKRTLRRLVVGFFISSAILYKRSTNWMLLYSIDEQEAKGIMEEVHEGTFNTHTNGHALACKILRVGYYWTKMESDCCQHGLDMIDPIEPKAYNGHRFILVAIDYFIKWVEATSYAV
ncbi:hypothetical protein CR513_60607, partial [Mucuna pruriens]